MVVLRPVLARRRSARRPQTACVVKWGRTLCPERCSSPEPASACAGLEARRPAPTSAGAPARGWVRPLDPAPARAHGLAQAPVVVHRGGSAPVAVRRRGPISAGVPDPAPVVGRVRVPGSVGARRSARAPHGVRVLAPALGRAVPGRARAPGAAPRRAGPPAEAAGRSVDRGTRSGCRPRARRSGGAALPRSARRSFPRRQGVHHRRRACRHAPRSTRGGGTRCRSRRRSAGSPSAPTSLRCLRTAPRPPLRPRPGFPPLPRCRCRGAARPRTGRIRCGTA